MRIYTEGEKVVFRAWDDKEGKAVPATVSEVHEERYELPKGQLIGAGGVAEDDDQVRMGGTAWYLLKPDGGGKSIRAMDREVGNPPSEKGGTFTALRKAMEEDGGGKEKQRATLLEVKTPTGTATMPNTRAKGSAGSKLVVRAPKSKKK